MKVTTQKIHTIIQSTIGVKSSKYSPSNKIDRTTYSIFTGISGVYGIMSPQFGGKIAEALIENGINVDTSKINKGLLTIKVFQNAN